MKNKYKMKIKAAIYILFISIIFGLIFGKMFSYMEEAKIEQGFYISDNVYTQGIGKLTVNFIHETKDNIVLNHLHELERLSLGIEELYISEPTQNDINNIGNLKGLKRLTFYSITGEEIDWSPISNLTKLEELTFSLFAHQKFDTISFTELKQLKNFYLYDSYYIEDLSFLSQAYSLRELTIAHVGIENTDLSYLQGLKELRVLEIDSLEYADLKYIEELKKLEYLRIVAGDMNNIESIRGLNKLSTLYLLSYAHSVKSKPELDLSILDEMNSLEVLGIAYMYVKDLEPLTKHEKLRYIQLIATDIEDITPLRKLDSLEYLTITGNESENVLEQGNEFFSELDLQIMEEIGAY